MNTYGYIEKRIINSSDIRTLCIEHNWFTEGTNEEYAELLDYGNGWKYEGGYRNITTDDLVEMATLIAEYSELDWDDGNGDPIPMIMFELAKICTSCFERM